MRTLLSLMAAALAGAAAGAGAMLLAFPFLFPPAPPNDPPPQSAALVTDSTASVAPVVSAGVFDMTSPGRDALHWADGGVGIYRQGDRLVLRLEHDFRAGPGPDFRLYLNTRAVGDEDGFLSDAGRIELAQLRAFSGGQNYLLPDDVNLADIRSVTIWCEQFSEFIGNAVLDRPIS